MAALGRKGWESLGSLGSLAGDIKVGREADHRPRGRAREEEVCIWGRVACPRTPRFLTRETGEVVVVLC